MLQPEQCRQETQAGKNMVKKGSPGGYVDRNEDQSRGNIMIGKKYIFGDSDVRNIFLRYLVFRLSS